MSGDYTTEQMKMWQHIVTFVWLRWVAPVSAVAFASGIIVGLGVARLLGWQP